MYRLFDAFAHRYDLHTPPHHYQHDHELVLELAREHGPRCRILDVGCGTGVLVEKALRAGFDTRGFDASARMIEVARRRTPADAVQVRRMQDLDEVGTCDLLVSLSWCVHYCSGPEELRKTIHQMRRSLRSGGRLLLQLAHGPNLNPSPWEDRESGPDGAPDDISLGVQFSFEPSRNCVNATYWFSMASTGESLEETHALHVADATEVAALARAEGFIGTVLWDSFRRDAFERSGSPFLYGIVP